MLSCANRHLNTAGSACGRFDQRSPVELKQDCSCQHLHPPTASQHAATLCGPHLDNPGSGGGCHCGPNYKGAQQQSADEEAERKGCIINQHELLVALAKGSQYESEV